MVKYLLLNTTYIALGQNRNVITLIGVARICKQTSSNTQPVKDAQLSNQSNSWVTHGFAKDLTIGGSAMT